MDGQPYAFIHVDGEEERHEGGSQTNLEEAKRVVELLLELRLVAGKTRVDNEWTSVDRVRVITFYQAQVALISKMLEKKGLKNIVVSTVDSSQGSESDVIIISFVRTGKQASVGFLTDNRRLNVALTRARHQLIVVGNANTLARVSDAVAIQALLEDARERGFILGDEEETSEVFETELATSV
jgi:senataxin